MKQKLKLCPPRQGGEIIQNRGGVGEAQIRGHIRIGVTIGVRCSG